MGKVLSVKELNQETLSLQELEELLDVKKSRIYELIAGGWLPKAKNGRFNLVECVSGYFLYFHDQIIFRKVR